VLARSRQELAAAYHALDLYLVTSRQEGGPKAVLESMAAGVPLVSTRVGQAQDLVEDGANGMLVDVDDVDALTERSALLHDDPGLGATLRAAGRRTAEAFALERLDGRWRALLSLLVDDGPAASVGVSR